MALASAGSAGESTSMHGIERMAAMSSVAWWVIPSCP